METRYVCGSPLLSLKILPQSPVIPISDKPEPAEVRRNEGSPSHSRNLYKKDLYKDELQKEEKNTLRIQPAPVPSTQYRNILTFLNIIFPKKM
jgi:hypothetical protein